MSAYTHHGDCSTSDPCKRCFEFGETTERRRIIKLLEEYIPTFYELSPNSDAGKYPIEGIIALIKGENK